MTKSFKKVIAVLLSVLMVLTTLPLTAMTAFADTDSDLANINAAITAYETKMNNMSIDTQNYPYTNMLPAYDAYVTANKLVDAYKYGNAGTKADLDNAATALNNATNSIGAEWVYTKPANANGVGTFDGSESDTIDEIKNNIPNGNYTLYNNNILNIGKVTGTTSGEKRATGYSAQAQNNGTYHCDDHNKNHNGALEASVYYYGHTVVLMDGVTEPRIPAMVSVRCYASTDDVRVYSIYPGTANNDRNDIYLANKNGRLNNSDVSTFEQIRGWKGSKGTQTADFTYAITNTNGSNEIGADVNNSLGYTSRQMNYGSGKGDYNKLYYYSSALVVDYNGIGMGTNAYKKVTNLPFYCKARIEWKHSKGFLAGNHEDHTDFGFALNYDDGKNFNIYAINYKLILDALKNSRAKFTADAFDIRNYRQGGLRDVILADEACENYYNNTFKNYTSADFDTEAEVINIANEVKATADQLNNVVNVKDSTKYTELKNAMIDPDKSYNQSAMKKYLDGNENEKNYTADSWAPFAAAYSDAQTFFANVTTAGYTMTDDEQKALAERIKLAEADLVINKVLADTSSIDTILDNAYAIVANKQYFNQSDYAASGIEALVTNCITEIWGSVENYGVDSAKAEESDAIQARIAYYKPLLITAVEANQFNYDSTVNGLGYSVNSAITEAAQYEATRADYANYATLEAAVEDANNMKQNYTGKVFDAEVPGQMKALATRYVSSATNIITAIRTLRPSFDKVTNGTIANPGREETLSYSMNGNRWSLKWTRSNEIIYFKTTRDALVKTLPVSYFRWSTTEKYDAMLDSLNLSADPDLPSQELTAKSCAAVGNTMPSEWELNQAQADGHPGGMSVQNANITLSLEGIYVSSSTKTEFAKDLQGNNITNTTRDLTDLLLTTEGTNPLKGGIIANKGDTVFTAPAKVSIPATTGSPSKTTTVTNKSKAFDTGAANAHFGFVYYYKYDPFLRWVGYSYEQSTYDQKIYVVDLAIYFELIQAVEAMNAEKNNYTTDSWNNLMLKLTSAKSYDYEGKDYSTITSELDAKYVALWDARAALKAPASNATLKAAYEACKDIYANDRSKCSAESWAAFETAYRNALGALEGKYSDINVRDFAQDDATAIADMKALADALIAAKDALAYLIDYTALDNAANTLVSSLADRTYTAESLAELKTQLESLTILKMGDAERNTHFTSETDFLAQIEAEIATIESLTDVLDSTSVDNSALVQTKQDYVDKYSDPDAFDIADIQAKLDAIDPDVTINFGVYPLFQNAYQTSVIGVKYTSQDEADAVCADALSSVKMQTYSVFVDGDLWTSAEYPDGKIPYGEAVEVTADDVVDWYYAFSSNTASADSKFYATADSISFVVKGDTNLVTKKAENADQVKVKFVNDLNGKPYLIKYVSAGTEINLSSKEYAAPGLAYYSFKNFVVAGKVATTLTATNEETIVHAMYDYTNTADYAVALVNLGFGSLRLDSTMLINDNNESGYDLKYNDKVEFDSSIYVDDYDAEMYGMNLVVAGESFYCDAADYGRDTDYSGDVYAWAKVDYADTDAVLDAFDINLANPGNLTAEAVLEELPGFKAEMVAYGPDYSFFVHEDAIYMALNEAEFEDFRANGIISDDYSIYTSENYRQNDNGTVSIVSTYCLPEGATIIENGILFAASKSTLDVSSLTLTAANSNPKVARMKSSVHTVGNQYVITINFGAKSNVTYNAMYRAYVTYEINGERVTQYSSIVDGPIDIVVA